MSVPKRQHWVPQFYLRHFAIPGQDSVWILHRKNGTPTITSTRNIAAKKYLYSPKNRRGERTFHLERKLGELEGTLAKLWPDLANGFIDLSSLAIRRALGLFLSVQFLRHPSRRAAHQVTRERIIQFISALPKGVDGLPDVPTVRIGDAEATFRKDAWLSFSKDGPEQDEWAFVEAIENEAVQYAGLLMNKRWSIVFIEEPLFVTSDFPLFVINQEMNRDQLAGRGAMLLFPLSPTRILCMDDLDAPPNQYHPVPLDDADLYNMFAWVNTDGFLISPRSIFDVMAGILRIKEKGEGEMASEA